MGCGGEAHIEELYKKVKLQLPLFDDLQYLYIRVD